MAPIEIRPITTTDLPARSPDTAATQAAARAGFNFDANTDGPWARTPAEFAVVLRELVTQFRRMHQVRASLEAGAPVPLGVEYVEGVWASAHWTVATQSEAPMTGEARPVCDAVIRSELEVADVMADLGRTACDGQHDVRGLGAYAEGVRAWFGWLSGAASHVPWPS